MNQANKTNQQKPNCKLRSRSVNWRIFALEVISLAESVISIWFFIIQHFLFEFRFNISRNHCAWKAYKVTLATQLVNAAFVWSNALHFVLLQLLASSLPTWRAEKKPNRAISPRRDLISSVFISLSVSHTFHRLESKQPSHFYYSRSFNWKSRKNASENDFICDFHRNKQAGKRMQQVSC